MASGCTALLYSRKGTGLRNADLLPKRSLIRRFAEPLMKTASCLPVTSQVFSGSAINLVAHSLGGLVVLNMLAQASAPRIRRIVLMGSPCGGSYCASVLLRIPLLAKIVGRSMRDASGRTHWDLPAGVEIGVLAGNRSFGLGRAICGLPCPNDGVVSIEETRLAGCSDAITLRVSHSEMLISKALRQAGGPFSAGADDFSMPRIYALLAADAHADRLLESGLLLAGRWRPPRSKCGPHARSRRLSKTRNAIQVSKEARRSSPDS